MAGGADLGVLAAGVAPSGRLWTAWGELESVPGAYPNGASGLALAGRFVIAVDWLQGDGSVAWAAVVPEG